MSLSRAFVICTFSLLAVGRTARAQPVPDGSAPARAAWLERQIASLQRLGFASKDLDPNDQSWNGGFTPDRLYVRCAAKLAEDGDVAGAQRLITTIKSADYSDRARARVARAQALARDFDGADRTANAIGMAHFAEYAKTQIAAARLPAAERPFASRTPSVWNYSEITYQERGAIAYWQRGHQSRAREMLRGLVAPLPPSDDGRHYTEVAVLQYRMGDSIGAAATLDVARAALPTKQTTREFRPVYPQLGLAAAYGRTGHPDEARALFATFAATIPAMEQKNPKVSASMRDNLARYQALSGDCPAALRTADSIDTKSRKFTGYRDQALEHIAAVEATDGDTASALSTADLLSSGDARDSALRAVACCLALCGEANAAWSAADRIRSSDARTEMHIYLLYRRVDSAWEKGDRDLARLSLRRALDTIAHWNHREVMMYGFVVNWPLIAGRAARIGDIPTADRIVAKLPDREDEYIRLCNGVTTEQDDLPSTSDLLNQAELLDIHELGVLDIDEFYEMAKAWPDFDRRYIDTPSLAVLSPHLLNAKP